eukprot:RCo018865
MSLLRWVALGVSAAPTLRSLRCAHFRRYGALRGAVVHLHSALYSTSTSTTPPSSASSSPSSSAEDGGASATTGPPNRLPLVSPGEMEQALARCGSPAEAYSAFYAMKRDGAVPDIGTYTALLGKLVGDKRLFDAYRELKHSTTLEPTEETFSVVLKGIRALPKNEQPPLLKEIMEDVKRRNQNVTEEQPSEGKAKAPPESKGPSSKPQQHRTPLEEIASMLPDVMMLQLSEEEGLQIALHDLKAKLASSPGASQEVLAHGLHASLLSFARKPEYRNIPELVDVVEEARATGFKAFGKHVKNERVMRFLVDFLCFYNDMLVK